MVMGELDTNSTDARDWALHQLGFNEQAESIDARSLLRFVADKGYVLSEETADAVQTAANPTAAVVAVTSATRQRRMGDQVTEFARVYFDLVPDKRRQRWQSLYDECIAIPSLQSWLDRLECGLDVPNVPALENERVNRLVSVSCKAFTSKPPAGIRLRQDFEMEYFNTYEDLQYDDGNWECATAELRSSHPAFLRKIAPWIEDIPEKEIPSRDEMVQLRRTHNLKGTPPEIPKPAPTNRATSWWILILVWLVLRILTYIWK